MKAKSLFMFETTYNYHEEDFSVHVDWKFNPLRKEQKCF